MPNEEENKTPAKTVSRRQFLLGTVGGLAIGAAAGAAAGSLGFPKTVTVTEQPWIPSTWDETADVVIIGYGGAGAVTAIAAHDAGANVLVLEKTPSYSALGVSNAKISGGGGNTAMNGGVVVVPLDATAGANHAYYLGLGTTPKAVCKAWADLAVDINKYLDNIGIKYTIMQHTAEMVNFPDASTITTTAITGGGAALFQALDKQVQNRNIKVLFGTGATDFIQDPTSRMIIGVKAMQYPNTVPSSGIWQPTNGTPLNIKASKGVVLAAGGFEYDDVMKANYLKVYPDHFYGWQYNTGDGQKMASKAGADMWHMNMFSGRCVTWFPAHDEAYTFGISASGTPMILTDKYGRRYADESSPAAGHNWWTLLTNYDVSVPEYTRVPTFMIFDSARFKAGPISMAAQGSTMGLASIPTQLGGATGWSKDNSVELQEGWIVQGNTPADLAAAINGANYQAWNQDDTVTVPSGINIKVDPTILTNTVNTYNGYCAAGSDPDFGRSSKTLLPFKTPPYYAVPLWPGGPNTQGGPTRNENAQVLDLKGTPIPHLYSAGECGSIWALYPTGGGNNSELITFGQIAGKNVAAETSWS